MLTYQLLPEASWHMPRYVFRPEALSERSTSRCEMRESPPKLLSCQLLLPQARGLLSMVMSTPLSAPKLLMLDMAERAAATSMVRATPGMPALDLHCPPPFCPPAHIAAISSAAPHDCAATSCAHILQAGFSAGQMRFRHTAPECAHDAFAS